MFKINHSHVKNVNNYDAEKKSKEANMIAIYEARCRAREARNSIKSPKYMNNLALCNRKHIEKEKDVPNMKPHLHGVPFNRQLGHTFTEGNRKKLQTQHEADLPDIQLNEQENESMPKVDYGLTAISKYQSVPKFEKLRARSPFYKAPEEGRLARSYDINWNSVEKRQDKLCLPFDKNVSREPAPKKVQPISEVYNEVVDNLLQKSIHSKSSAHMPKLDKKQPMDLYSIPFHGYRLDPNTASNKSLHKRSDSGSGSMTSTGYDFAKTYSRYPNMKSSLPSFMQNTQHSRMWVESISRTISPGEPMPSGKLCARHGHHEERQQAFILNKKTSRTTARTDEGNAQEESFDEFFDFSKKRVAQKK